MCLFDAMWRIFCCSCNEEEEEEEYKEEEPEQLSVPLETPTPTPTVVQRTTQRLVDIKAENQAADRLQHMQKAHIEQVHDKGVLSVCYPRKRTPMCFQLMDQREVENKLTQGKYEDSFDLAKSDESLFWNTVNLFGTRIDIIDEQIKKKTV
jgi:hypothetical protein